MADLLDDQVVVIDDRDFGQETASEGRFGYASRHLLIALDAARESQPAYEPLRGGRAQVQVRTVLQHAWAEFEHDIRYKGDDPRGARAATSTAGSRWPRGCSSWPTRSSPRSATGCRPACPAQAPPPEDDDPRIDPRELAAFLAGQYADAGWSRTDHYAWISGLLLELGITSLDELARCCAAVDGRGAQRADGLPLPARRRTPPRRRPARGFGDRYVALHGNAHRVAALRARLEKIFT